MKKILAIMLSLCMLFSVFATSVVAAGENDVAADSVHAEGETVILTEDTAAPSSQEVQTEETVSDTAPALLAAEPADASHPHTADTHTEYAGKTWTAWDGSASTIVDSNNYGISGYYYLTGNATMEKWIDVRSNQNIVICLNGYSLTGPSGARMFRIAGGATVTVCDCGQGGKLLPQANAAGAVAGLYKEGTTNAGGFYMNGGTIEGKTSFTNSLIYMGCATTVSLTGATLTGNNSANGGAITVGASGAVLNLTNTTISGCQATGDGGAIYAATAGALINISSSTISGNTAGSEGGALYINSIPADTTKDNITITNTAITGNEASGGDNGGGAIFFREGKMTLDGVTLTGNKNKGRHGSAITYGVINTSVHSLVLKDCTITGNMNMSEDKRAGVAVVGNVSVTVSGKTVIDDNRNGTNASWEGGTECNLLLRNSAKLTVDALAAGADVQVTTDYTVGEDPDDFLTYTDATPVMEQTNADRITHENVSKIVGYNAANRFFYETVSDHWHAACACAIEGAACEHTAAAADVAWTKWDSANSLPTTAGYYYLASDVELSGRQTIVGDVYICLNNHSITRASGTAAISSMIRVGDNSNLTIMNCGAKVTDGMLDSASTAGIKNGNSTDTWAGGIWVNQNSSLTLLGVEVSGNKCASTNTSGWSAGAIMAVGAANTTTRITVAYGRFSDNHSTAQGGGAIILRGGSADIRNTVFTGNTAGTNGGAIWLTNGSPKLELTDCEFTLNQAKSGGAIYVTNGSVDAANVKFSQNTGTQDGGVLYLGGGTAEFTDCEFTKNTAKYGGVVYLPQGAAASTKLTMTGGSIHENTANGGCAAGLYLSAGVTELSGVEIKNNTSSGNMGSAITVGVGANDTQNPSRYTTKVTLHDCTVTGNNNSASAAKRGGVTVYCGDQTLTISGKTVIDNNTNGGTECNIFLREATAKVTVGQLTEGASFDITTGDHKLDEDGNALAVEDPDAFLTKGVEGDWDPAWSIGCITYTNNMLPVGYSDEEVFYFYLSGDHVHCLCSDESSDQCGHSDIAWQPWESATTLPTVAGNWYLTEDVQLATAATLNGTTEVNLCLNGHTVTASSARDRAFYVLNDDSVLTVSDCGEGQFTGAADSGFRLRDTAGGATLNIYGGKITGNERTGSGGAIMLFGKGTLNIYGGEISDNTSTSSGGAIAAEGDSEVNVYGGVISGNEAAGSGGGISLKGSQLNMQGGVIENNIAAVEGGGVYAQLSSTVNMDGGEISGNEADEKGGGVFIIDSCTMTLADGEIKDNTSVTAGGVFVANNCEMTMAGGEISGNDAYNGGGIATYKAKVTIGGGTIKNNKAELSGGGIRVQQDSTLDLKGGLIEGNTATDVGGGIWAQLGSKVNVSGGTVKGNKAGKGGGILIIDSSEMTFTGGLFTGNHASDNGGGVFIANNSKMTMTGGQINGNTGTTGAGMALYKAEVTMEGGEVKNNTATKAGGGIRVQRESTFTLKKGTIESNKAGTEGGGIVVQVDSTLKLLDGDINKNSAEKGGGILLIDRSVIQFSGGHITNNKASNNGGGLFVANTCTGQITGGTISGNSAVSGAGLALYKSTVNMSGGYIANNTASQDAGGVSVQQDSTMRFSGGTIEKNTAKELGGGVYVWRDSTFYMSGGNVRNNTANKGGGVMMIDGASMTLSGGIITNNKATNNGGGLFPANNTKLTMTGGTISGNSAVSGAGMAAYLAEVTITGGTIKNNGASENGGAILIQRESQVKIEKVTFDPNTAAVNGGGIHISGGADLVMTEVNLSNQTAGSVGGALFASGNGTTIKMTDCTITRNTAVSGGGVAIMAHAALETTDCVMNENAATDMGGGGYIRKAYYVMNGGEVCNNTATNSGGGLHVEGVDIVMTRQVFIMNGGLVSGNTASKGGGIYMTRDTYAVLSGGTVTDNEAQLGGGIYAGATTLSEICDTEITDNEATVQGGGVYLQRGSRTIMDGAVVSGNKAVDGGGGIWVDDDFTMNDLTVKGNSSKNGAGGVHIAAANYDGHSYVSSVIKMSGDMYIYENSGEFADLYISEGTFVNLPAEGLGANAKLGIRLQSGLLTRTLIGSYDYEGGELEYIVTAGDRSVTDPEVLPAEEMPEGSDVPVQEEEQEQSNTLLVCIVLGVILILALVIILLILLRKKKNKKEAEV